MDCWGGIAIITFSICYSLGWATELPVLVRLNYLEEAQRPASSDPQYWDAWVATKNDEFKTDWWAVAERWQSTGQTDSFEDTEQVMNSDFEKDGVEPPF